MHSAFAARQTIHQVGLGGGLEREAVSRRQSPGRLRQDPRGYCKFSWSIRGIFMVSEVKFTLSDNSS